MARVFDKRALHSSVNFVFDNFDTTTLNLVSVEWNFSWKESKENQQLTLEKYVSQIVNPTAPMYFSLCGLFMITFLLYILVCVLLYQL